MNVCIETHLLKTICIKRITSLYERHLSIEEMYQHPFINSGLEDFLGINSGFLKIYKYKINKKT